MTEGFLVVDKPSGITSHDVVARVRRATGIRKVGHAGTLDPMATGVVVVAIGRVTRLIRFLQDQDKEYVATACFGVATDTLDADGNVTDTTPMDVTEADVRSAAARFVGRIDQVPPMVSALKKDGRRLYELAREGVEVERPPRPVDIHEIEILSVTPGPHPSVDFRVVCGKGTYVRSLADDIARALGGFAHLTALRRTRSGGLDLAHAVGADDLSDWESHLIPPIEALAGYPTVDVDAETAGLIRNGRRIRVEGTGDGITAVRGPGGGLVAVCTVEGGTFRPEVVLA